MAADEADLITQRQKLFLDRPDQRIVIAAWQIRTPHRTLEQHVAHMGKAGIMINMRASVIMIEVEIETDLEIEMKEKKVEIQRN